MTRPGDEFDEPTPRPQDPPRSPIDQVRQDILDEEWRRERDYRGLSSRVDKTETALVVIAGPDGKNGKLGNLRADVDGMRKFVIALVLAIVTGLGGLVAVAWKSASEAGRRDAVIEQLTVKVGAQDAVIEMLRQAQWASQFQPKTRDP